MLLTNAAREGARAGAVQSNAATVDSKIYLSFCSSLPATAATCQLDPGDLTISKSAGQFILIVGVTAGMLPLAGVVFMASTGADFKTLAATFGILFVFGIYGPRLWLGSRIKRRQKAIWKSIPDAFDLITASIEAGLGIDAAFARVLEKTQGPFAYELAKTMREIQMGRLRKEALKDLGDRCDVEELRSLLNAVIQAETMGISLGTVIRVQTGVLRTKRRQAAEERAFKAPVKMVFPLVLFIFPAIMVVIGGPAVVQIMERGGF
jgi:tight adherence protein C